MGNEFKPFSDAGQLYAKYSSVVDEMWELFKADIGRFHDALKIQVQAAIHPRKMEEDLKDTTRSWWLLDPSPSPREDDVPYIYLDRKTPETINPGRLRLHVYFDGSDDEMKRRISAVRDKLNLPANCECVKDGRYFAIVVTYGDSDPVAASLEPTRIILKALDEIGN